MDQAETYVVLTTRSAGEADVGAVLGLIEEERRRNQWLEQVPELLAAAVRGTEANSWACVGISQEKHVGVGVCAIVAGTVGTGVIQTVVTVPDPNSQTSGDLIIRHLVDVLRSHGARVVTADLPDHSAADHYRSLLIAHGFVEEGRVEDYYADGVSLLHYRFDFD